jgi:hypothetical protein
VLDALLYDPNLDVSSALVGDKCLPLTSLDDLDPSLVLGLDDDTIDVDAIVASGVLPRALFPFIFAFSALAIRSSALTLRSDIYARASKSTR